MHPVARIIIALTVFLLVLPGASRSELRRDSSQWRVIELPSTGGWFEGRTEHRPGSALGRTGAFGRGDHSIYLVDLAPGVDYTLGLRYPADAGSKPSVMLFDRWPLDPEAKRYKLPMGPVVRTNPDWIEYRWRLGISGRSKGNMAFVAVEAGPGVAAPTNRFRHFMYLTTPAVRPMNQIGTGITYLRGPSDLFLPQWTGQVQYIVEYPYGGRDLNNRRGNDQLYGEDLIYNGDFSQGLQGWKILEEKNNSENKGHAALGKEGLRLWGESPDALSGVRQTIKTDVRETRSLSIALGLRIDNGSTRRFMDMDESAVVELSICYQDTERAERCGAKAYRKSFSASPSNGRSGPFIVVKKGEWYRFEDELMELDPRPEVIESISITGTGLKNSEILIGSVTLAVQ